jgi:hypothetical protein
MFADPVTPLVVKVVDSPTQETTVGDILLGAVGLVGVILLLAALVGFIAGGVFILVRKRLDSNASNEDREGLRLSSLGQH